MYSAVKVDKLSPNQVSKLLNHHGVRVKLNPHGPHTIHVSKEQNKKLHKAHSKGSGAIITFDPYQVHHHQHLRGPHRIKGPRRLSGKGTNLLDQDFTGNDVAHFLGAHESSEPLMNSKLNLNQAKDAGNRVKHFLGLGVKKSHGMRGLKKHMKGAGVLEDINHFFKPIGSAMVHDVLPQAGGILGGIAASEMGPIGALAGAAAGRAAAQQAANAIASKTGLGIKKRGRPKKVGVAHTGGALVAAGYGVKHKKKAGRPKK